MMRSVLSQDKTYRLLITYRRQENLIAITVGLFVLSFQCERMKRAVYWITTIVLRKILMQSKLSFSLLKIRLKFNWLLEKIYRMIPPVLLSEKACKKAKNEGRKGKGQEGDMSQRRWWIKFFRGAQGGELCPFHWRVFIQLFVSLICVIFFLLC